VGEAGYIGEASDMMDDYQQSADESDLEQDVANEDYVEEGPDDFDVTCLSILIVVCIVLVWGAVLANNLQQQKHICGSFGNPLNDGPKL